VAGSGSTTLFYAADGGDILLTEDVPAVLCGPDGGDFVL